MVFFLSSLWFWNFSDFSNIFLTYLFFNKKCWNYSNFNYHRKHNHKKNLLKKWAIINTL